MGSFEFPPVEQATVEGLLAVGGDLTVPTLKAAYGGGIFPWPAEGYPLLWFAPPRRAVLDFKDFRIPKRLERALKKTPFTFKIDADFEGVIRSCAASPNRKGQSGTWILPMMVEAYIRFHRAGFARSFEAYNPRGELVGGMYGVLLDRAFAGESMFYSESGASKFVLVRTVEYLKGIGLDWMDVQVLTPLLKSFGAKEIPRALFMKRLKKAAGPFFR